ncbi:MAG: hypothetical protein ACLFSQ_03990 [Candidatus Zixiibacteriota bacterium]
MEQFEQFKRRVHEKLENHALLLKERDSDTFDEEKGEIFRQIKLGQVESFRAMFQRMEEELDDFALRHISRDNPLYHKLFIELLDCSLNQLQTMRCSALSYFSG